MIVILRGNVPLELRGLHFGHRSEPGDELVADHLLGQLPRRAAVRRDDPAAPLSPRLLPSRHHSLQSSGSYARGALRATAPARRSCGLGCAKMERVSEVLQLPVVVQGRRPRVREPQLLEKLDFLRGRGAAEGGVLKEFLETGLFADRMCGFTLYKRESIRLPLEADSVQVHSQIITRLV